MPSVNCPVNGCTNSQYKIRKWKKELRDIHNNVIKELCGCERPFYLYCFASIKNNNEQRQNWIKLIKREGHNKSKWTPAGSDRVCSFHFADGVPTAANPDPTLNMGYELLQKRPRRELFRSGVVPNCKKKKLLNEEVDEAVVNDNVDNVVNDNVNVDDNVNNELPCQSSSFFSPVSEHSYFSSSLTQQCEGCSYKKNVIDSLVSKINMLTLQVKTANRVKVFNTKKSVFTWRKIKTDQKMNFYTGIVSIAMFESVFQLLNPYLSKIRYWRGPKRANSYSKVKRTYSTPASKILTHRDEFLLTLMRLRLGLLNEDLADRFGISPTICSNTFTTWIQILSKILGNALVVWLPREATRDNLPDAFTKTGHSKCRVIIDCTEVFIAIPKSLLNQAATWSDYKHHNTIKFLIGISSAGFITFLSDCYGGRASDRYITKDSGFYELLERDDEVMTDRGF
ncbi:uncharacterized protein LOC130648217 [Hydractinia symbiolongicarpus]|uniref:uncharacterized protein LOC130648217 n=1 Tax=Hydractinia symbiolongicarpus TaxID=13093 RepID=UPI00254DEAE4|nr:uncharacterized protein LOC130648217 [Hydractinia symbiolongicarpus]